MAKPNNDSSTKTYSRNKITRAFSEFIEDESFPCLAARGIGKRQDFFIGSYGRMDSHGGILRLAEDLREYTEEWDNVQAPFRTFVAVFPDELTLSELAFERRLWSLLGSLSEQDVDEWDVSVSSDPSDADFSFSFAGEAYYVIGLHPGSARPARRFRHPALVFNRHSAFEELRESGVYDRMRDLIRERDLVTNGSINPMVADFGSTSEAPQYSGRKVDSDWQCPFAQSFTPRKIQSTEGRGEEKDG